MDLNQNGGRAQIDGEKNEIYFSKTFQSTGKIVVFDNDLVQVKAFPINFANLVAGINPYSLEINFFCSTRMKADCYLGISPKIAQKTKTKLKNMRMNIYGPIVDENLPLFSKIDQFITKEITNVLHFSMYKHSLILGCSGTSAMPPSAEDESRKLSFERFSKKS